MMYAQYLRLETKAGGCTATPREFVKACHTVLKQSGKARNKRDVRHQWIREGLIYLNRSRVEYVEIITGRISNG